MDQDAIPNNAQPVEAQPKARPELEQDFGDWMMVRKPVRKRPPRIEVKDGAGGRTVVAEPPLVSPPAKSVSKTIQNSNSSSPRAQIGLTSEIRGDGSRFSVLEGDNDDLPILEEVVEDVMEKPSYATVNRGESSQAPNLIKEPFSVGFNLGKDKISTPKKIVVAIKPIIPPVKQNSKSKPTRKQILRVKDTNVTIQARSMVPSKPALCKENSIPLIPATPRENSLTRNHAESNPMPTPTVHLPPFLPSSHAISLLLPPEKTLFVGRQMENPYLVEVNHLIHKVEIVFQTWRSQKRCRN